MPELNDFFKNPEEAFDGLFEGALLLNPSHDENADDIENYSGIPLNNFIAELTGATEDSSDDEHEAAIDNDDSDEEHQAA